MAKPNYRHAKKQKETARKARQEAKAQRRAAVPGEAGVVTETADLPESQDTAVPLIP